MCVFSIKVPDFLKVIPQQEGQFMKHLLLGRSFLGITLLSFFRLLLLFLATYVLVANFFVRLSS